MLYVEFAHLLNSLRMRDETQTLTKQASILGVSLFSLAQLLHSFNEVPESWIEKIKSAYSLSDEDVSVAAHSPPPATLLDGAEPMGDSASAILSQLSIDSGLSLHEISDLTHLPMRYLNVSMHAGEKVDRFLCEKILENVPISAPLQQRLEGLVRQGGYVQFTGRTVAQRALLWQIGKSLPLFTDVHMAEMRSVLDDAKREGKLYSADETPLQQFLGPEFDVGNDVLSQEALLDTVEALSLPSGLWRAFEYLNDISASQYNEPNVLSSAGTEQLDFYDCIKENLSYISDPAAEQIFEILWRVVARKVRIKSGRRSMSLWTPVGIYLRWLQRCENISLAEFGQKVNVPLSKLSMISCGVTDMSYAEYESICNQCSLSSAQKEFLRYLIWSSLRYVVIDTYGGTPLQHVLAEELQRNLINMSEKEITEILKIVQAASTGK